MNFYYIFLKLCNSIGKSPSKVAVEIGSTRAAVNRWKNGSMPSDITLLKLADYFGVSVEYLKGETENPSVKNDKGDREWTVYAMDGEPGAQTVNVNINVMDELNELLKTARNLPVEKIRLLAEVAKSMQ